MELGFTVLNTSLLSVKPDVCQWSSKEVVILEMVLVIMIAKLNLDYYSVIADQVQLRAPYKTKGTIHSLNSPLHSDKMSFVGVSGN